MKKPQLKQLRQAANKLPKETYKTIHSSIQIRSWRGLVRKQVNTVNHYRRLKRLIKAGYFNEAREYIFKRTNQNSSHVSTTSNNQ